MVKTTRIGFVFFLAWTLLTCIVACRKFETNPYDLHLDKDLPSNLNAQNLERLKLLENDAQDTLRFIFTGDSQRFYEELQDLVKKVNSLTGIHFLVIAGDITDFGLKEEFRWIYEHLKKLNVPYIGVVGNHDLAGNGMDLYEKIFGAKNFSFRFKGVSFICHDSNSREYGYNGLVPDLSFIGREMKDPLATHLVGLSHVPPFNGDFDPALEMSYANLLSSDPRFLLSLHGHLHGTLDSVYYPGHVRYIVAPAVQKREAILIKIHNGIVYKQFVPF